MHRPPRRLPSVVMLVAVLLTVVMTACSQAPAPAATSAPAKPAESKPAEAAKPAASPQTAPAAPVAAPASPAASPAAAASPSPSPAAAAKPTGPAVPVRWHVQENASQAYIPALMKEKGIDVKYGIEVQMIGFSQNLVQWNAMRAGESDLSSGSFLDLLRQRNNGLKAQAIDTFSTYGNPIVSLSSKPYTRIADLKGQKVGTPNATLLDWMIIRAAGKKAEGIDLEADTQMQAAAPGLINGLLDKGDLDAALQYSDFTLGPVNQGKYKELTTVPTLMAAGGLDPEALYLTFNLSDAWREKNPTLVPGLVAAIEETRDLMMTDDSVWPALAKRSGMEDQSLMTAFIAKQRASFKAPYSDAKLAPTQALIAALLETVGQTPIGITSVDASAFDFKSIEAAKGLRR
jgi:NitT/TauT family transport system substrate-binding protein